MAVSRGVVCNVGQSSLVYRCTTYRNENVVRHQYCGIEFTQEAIFGSPLLYVSVGIGAGYIFLRVSGEFSPAKLNLY